MKLGDIAAMFFKRAPKPPAPEPPPPPKQNKRLSAVVQKIAFEVRAPPLRAQHKIIWPLIRKKSRITSRQAETVLLGLQRRRARKKTLRQTQRKSRARNAA